MGFVLHQKAAGKVSSGEKASRSIQETIAGFYT